MAAQLTAPVARSNRTDSPRLLGSPYSNPIRGAEKLLPRYRRPKFQFPSQSTLKPSTTMRGFSPRVSASRNSVVMRRFSPGISGT
jgi:hypothetical protein